MNHQVDVPVAVIFGYFPNKGKVYPLRVTWDGRDYTVTKVGYHHHYRLGRTLFHVFSVVAGPIFFELVLDTDTLFWRLKEVSDGEPQ